LIAGTKWQEAERMLLNNQKDFSPERISKFIFNKEDELELAIMLFKESNNFAVLTPRKRAQFFAHLLGIYHSRLSGSIYKKRRDADEYIFWLSEYALRLASSDKNVVEWAGENLVEANCWLLWFPSLILLSRLLVSLVQKAINSPDCTSSQYPGWQWE
jgi:hypothetical protein